MWRSLREPVHQPQAAGREAQLRVGDGARPRGRRQGLRTFCVFVSLSNATQLLIVCMFWFLQQSSCESPLCNVFIYIRQHSWYVPPYLQAMKLNVNSGESFKFTEDQIYCSSPEFVARPGAVVSTELIGFTKAVWRWSELSFSIMVICMIRSCFQFWCGIHQNITRPFVSICAGGSVHDEHSWSLGGSSGKEWSYVWFLLSLSSESPKHK